MEPTVASPKNGERWLTVVGSKDAESQCLGFVRRFAKGDAEIHLAKPSGSDSANELRRLAIALEVDWLCMVAERGMGLMSLFLRSDVERILRAAPCPVICIPEFPLATRERQSLSQKADAIRRILVPIKFLLQSRGQVENAVAVAERFGAKLDLLGVREHLRNPDASRTVSYREAKRLEIRAVKKELSNLADETIPNRMRGRLLVSVGFPLFYAATRWARELDSHLVVLAAPTGLWTSEGRIDVGTERILHGVGCPVICIPEHGEPSNGRRAVVRRTRAHDQRRDWHAPSRFSLRQGLRRVPKCKGLNASRHEAVASTINQKRFDAYETANIGN